MSKEDASPRVRGTGGSRQRACAEEVEVCRGGVCGKAARRHTVCVTQCV